MKSIVTTSFGQTKMYSSESLPDRESVMVVPGYSETLSHSKKLVDALGKNFNAFTANAPRERGDRSLDPIQRQSEAVLEVLDAATLKDKKVHAVAHSLGSAAVLKAAIARPERFASVTIVEPIGLVGEQSFTELGKRTGKKVVKNQVGALRGQDPDKQPKHGYAAAADKESALHFSARVGRAQLAGSGALLKQPRIALREARAVGRYDIADDIAKAHELGIAVNIVKAHSDELFDEAKVDEHYIPLAEHVHSYSEVADPTARHDTFWMQPERTAQIVGQLIDQS